MLDYICHVGALAIVNASPAEKERLTVFAS